VFVIQLVIHDESDLRFDPGLHDLCRRDDLTVGHLHICEQHAVIGLIHAELCLDGRVGQTDLAAHQWPTGTEP
jgi:hypothetical protein